MVLSHGNCGKVLVKDDEVYIIVSFYIYLLRTHTHTEGERESIKWDLGRWVAGINLSNELKAG